MTPTITGMSAEEHVSGWGRLKANDEVDSKSRAEGCIANGGRAASGGMVLLGWTLRPRAASQHDTNPT